MPDTALAPAGQACVWMEAGVIGYRLCSQGFDCDHCLLDAALHGPAGPSDACPMAAPWPTATVPENRFYATGHTWLQPVADATIWRFGIDAFAAALLGRPARVRCAEPGRALRAGDLIAHIELDTGTLSLEAPVPCRVLHPNATLAERPQCLVRDPYDEGWILELGVTDLAGLLALGSPATARERFDLDLARFTRTVALDLIAATGTAGRAALQAGHPLTTLTALIGPARYLELLQDFIR